MDIFGTWESEEFISTIQRIVRAGDANGIPAGFPLDVLGGAAAGIAWVKEYTPTLRLLTIGGDLSFVSQLAPKPHCSNSEACDKLSATS